jgi:tripartite-type tricarboxylate transporter receptor subunit TctC
MTGIRRSTTIGTGTAAGSLGAARLSRRHLLVASLAVLAAGCRGALPSTPTWRGRTGPEAAPDAAAESTQVVVPWAVGGATDQLVRLVAEYWPLASPLPLAVRNVTGSGGTIGAREVLSARPDGYTLLAGHESLLTAYYLGQASFNWTDFEPIGGMFSLPEVVVTRKSRPWRDVAELLDDAQRRPEQIPWAATFGSRSHFLPGEIMWRSGARFRLIGYDGAASCLAALLAGEVDVANASLAALQEPARGGKLRLLGTTGRERAATLPDLPTLREQGLDVTFAINLGLLAPKGTPPSVLGRLEQSLQQVLADADLQQRAQDELQAQVRFLPRREYTAQLAQLDEAIRVVAENLGLRA